MQFQMGALAGNSNNLRSRKSFLKEIKKSIRVGRINHPGMRPRPPFLLRMPPPGIRPIPPFVRGNRLPPPPIGLGLPVRGPIPRPFPPNMRPPLGMRPLPPHMMRPMIPMQGPVVSRGNFFRQLPPQLIPHSKLRRIGITKGLLLRKKRPLIKTHDLSKPWVTDSIKTEFSKKEQLLKTAKSSQKHDDWAIYRDQREKCSGIYEAAKKEYAERNPEDVRIPQLMPSNQTTPVLTAPIDYTADVTL